MQKDLTTTHFYIQLVPFVSELINMIYMFIPQSGGKSKFIKSCQR